MSQINNNDDNRSTDFLNKHSDQGNKILSVLNSGAFVAALHFYALLGIGFIFEPVSPIVYFTMGLTFNVLTYFFNYLNAWHAYNHPRKKDHDLLVATATVCAITSGLSLLAGIWIIAMAFHL